jgi:hypothetical protein
MKKVTHLTSAFLLIIVITVTSFGGIIDCPAPSPPPTAASSATTPGDIGLPRDGHAPGSPSELAVAVALNLLTDLLVF